MSGSAAAVRLRADNFTPATRTPWGGRRIVEHYKQGLDVPAGGVVGESWEVSVEPSFPSLTEGGETLASLIAGDPGTWLGSASVTGQTTLLIKLLDAADNLSVQVHPAPDDPALGSDESGKPEAWIVLEADAGAGLYLGFRDGVDEARVRRALMDKERLDELMNFVPVKPGDAFTIEAGTAHAIGGGVTLLEPQHVEPGRRGLTYRFWDWNRRYDEQGNQAADGKPRELHIERSLAVTTWGVGRALVERCRSMPEMLSKGEGVSRSRVVSWPFFDVEAWQGSGAASFPPTDALVAVVCVKGTVTIEGLTLRGGQSGVVPAALAAQGLSLTLNGAQAYATYVTV